jgi:hypothetical protein
MIRKFAVALALGVSSLTLSAPAFAQTPTTEAVDPARLKLAETMANKIIPVGSYQKMMKDVADQMVDGMLSEMLGMDAAAMAKAVGEDGKGLEGKSLGELAGAGDPHFKERTDIIMKVTFDEMGKLMGQMEPAARTALAKVYARKYSMQQLTDMNAFFTTPSGSAFAADFMATFTDKEMMQAMMGEMPKLIEAMPAITKKVEEATAHLPPPPKLAEEAAMAAAETASDAPWMQPENWDAKDRKKYEAVLARYEKANETAGMLDEELSAIYTAATDSAKARYLAEGWKAPKPEPNPYDEEQLETLRKGWSAADNEAVTAQINKRDLTNDALAQANKMASHGEYVLDAAFKQAMINAGQIEGGVKRPIAEAIEAAAKEAEETYNSSDAAQGAQASPGSKISTDAARLPN